MPRLLSIFNRSPIWEPVLELDRSDSARQCGHARRRCGKWSRGAAVQRRDISLPRRRFQRAATAGRNCAARLQLRFQNRSGACRRGRSASDGAGQPQFVPRRDRSDQITQVRHQCALHRRLGGGHRSRRRPRYRARGQQTAFRPFCATMAMAHSWTIHPFAGISGIRGFAWADLDGDGNPDAAIIDGAGRLHVFMNERQGQFRERPLPGRFGAGESRRSGGSRQRRCARSAGGAGRRRHRSNLR